MQRIPDHRDALSREHAPSPAQLLERPDEHHAVLPEQDLGVAPGEARAAGPRHADEDDGSLRELAPALRRLRDARDLALPIAPVQGDEQPSE